MEKQTENAENVFAVWLVRYSQGAPILSFKNRKSCDMVQLIFDEQIR